MATLTSGRITCACCGEPGSRWWAFGDMGPTRVRENCVACPDCSKPMRLILDGETMALDCRSCQSVWELTVPVDTLGLEANA